MCIRCVEYRIRRQRRISYETENRVAFVRIDKVILQRDSVQLSNSKRRRAARNALLDYFKLLFAI